MASSNPMRTLPSLVTLAAIVATSAPAAADAPVGFATLDHTGDPAKVDASLAYGALDDADEALLRIELHGQAVGRKGFGGYAGIAAAALIFDESDDGAEAVGDLQLGFLYQTRSSPSFDLGVRAGLVLPTGSDDDDRIVYAASTLWMRPSDIATVAPDTTWLRLGASPTFHDEVLFLRADLGLDIPILDEDAVDGDLVGHLNVGAGIGGEAASVTAEIQTAFLIGADGEDNVFHTGALSVRLRAGGATPYLAISTPLDDGDETFGGRGDVITAMLGVSAWL